MALREGAKIARKPKADLRPNERRNESIAIFSPQFGGGARARISRDRVVTQRARLALSVL